MKTFALIALKVAAAVALVWWIVERGGLDWSDFTPLMQPKPFAALFGLVVLQIWVANLRWQVLLFDQGIAGDMVSSTFTQRLNHWSLQTVTLPLTLIGLFFNYAVPGSVGGDLVKAFYLTKRVPARKLDASISILVDRLVGFFVMLASGAIAFYVFRGSGADDSRLDLVGWITLSGALSFLAFFVLSFSARVRQALMTTALGRAVLLLPGASKMKLVYGSLHAYRKRPRAIVLAMALSAVNQVLLVLFFAVVGWVQGEAVPSFGVYWFCIPLGLVLMSVPIAPAGVGVGQAAFFFLFELYLGRPSSLGSTGVTALQLMQFLASLVGAFFYLRQGWVASRSDLAGKAA